MPVQNSTTLALLILVLTLSSLAAVAQDTESAKDPHEPESAKDQTAKATPTEFMISRPSNAATEETKPENEESPANKSTVEPSAPSIGPTALPFPESKRISVLDRTHLDLFSILTEDTPCSRFFGGAPAIEVLNTLILQLKPGWFHSSIAVKMGGQTINYNNVRLNLSYRVFERAELNLGGPFYKAGAFPTEPSIPHIGNFPPNTREARAIILLHELGHMIRRPDKQWVLPNDGDDQIVSRANTYRIKAVCDDEIRKLKSLSLSQQFAKVRGSR